MWGFMRNMKGARAERIQSILKVVTGNSARTPSLPAVRAFLDSKVARGFLQISAGEYKLAPSLATRNEPPR